MNKRALAIFALPAAAILIWLLAPASLPERWNESEAALIASLSLRKL